MKKYLIFFILFSGIFISISSGMTENANQLIDKIRLMPEDIPQGFIYGLVPDGAKTVLKNNPWTFDKTAIEKLTDKIYPGGDSNQVFSIHLTIFAKKETPHRDDIVCYIIQYKNKKATFDEYKKFSEFAGFNQDRSVLHIKDNFIVFLFADDINYFPLIQELDKKITERMNKS